MIVFFLSHNRTEAHFNVIFNVHFYRLSYVYTIQYNTIQYSMISVVRWVRENGSRVKKYTKHFNFKKLFRFQKLFKKRH